jgi:predicted Zn-ribbon and HTH transcriptional regulator
MMNANDQRVISLQQMLHRTHVGRWIRGEAEKLLSTEPSEGDGPAVECADCGFVFYSRFFANGCPNCNSRADTKG